MGVRGHGGMRSCPRVLLASSSAAIHLRVLPAYIRKAKPTVERARGAIRSVSASKLVRNRGASRELDGTLAGESPVFLRRCENVSNALYATFQATLA